MNCPSYSDLAAEREVRGLLFQRDDQQQRAGGRRAPPGAAASAAVAAAVLPLSSAKASRKTLSPGIRTCR